MSAIFSSGERSAFLKVELFAYATVTKMVLTDLNKFDVNTSVYRICLVREKSLFYSKTVLFSCECKSWCRIFLMFYNVRSRVVISLVEIFRFNLIFSLWFPFIILNSKWNIFVNLPWIFICVIAIYAFLFILSITFIYLYFLWMPFCKCERNLNEF